MVGRLSFENRIHDKLYGRKHLIPIFTSSLNIPERLRELDPDYFVVFNATEQRYEVHSLYNKDRNTLAFVVPYSQLDNRTIEYAKQTNVRLRGEEIFDEIDRHNEWIEKELRRKRSDELKYDVAERLKKPFANLAWEGE